MCVGSKKWGSVCVLAYMDKVYFLGKNSSFQPLKTL